MSVEKLVLPGGAVFGGAPSFSMRGRDNAVYVVYCGERAGKKFGTHAFRVLPNGDREWIELPVFTEGRVGVTIEADGAYLAFPTDRDTAVLRVKLPGFVPLDYAGELPPPVAPPPLPQGCVDEDARSYTSAVKKELNGALAKLDSRVKELENRTVESGNGGLNADQVWQLARDSVYADLIERNKDGIAQEVADIAQKVVYGLSVVTKSNVREVVREELLNLLAQARISL